MDPEPDDDDGVTPTRSRRPRLEEAVRSRTGRRGFLGALAGLGAAAGGAGLVASGGDHASRPDEVPIVYGLARTDPADPTSIEPLRKSVDATWYAETTRALSIHQQLPLSALSGVVQSFVVPGDVCDPRATISILGTTGAVDDVVSSLSDDVSVDVTIVGDLPDVTGESSGVDPAVVADLADPVVPGGVFCGTGAVSGSLAPALSDPSTGERYFATANHLFGGAGTDHRGEPLYLEDGGGSAQVARLRRGFAHDDFVLAEPVGGRFPASDIRDAAPGPVAGQFTLLGLADLKARGEPLHKVAAVSGHTSGPVKGVDGTTFYTGNGVRTGQLLWGSETTFTDGDSGSVSYHVDPGDDGRLLVAGLNVARTWWPGADFTWGAAAYTLREDHGLVF